MTQDILNLDEFFGAALSKAITIKWKNKKYSTLQLELMSPKQMLQFDKLGAEIQQIKDGEITDDVVEKYGRLLAETVNIICPELPVNDVPFIAQLKVLDFYMQKSGLYDDKEVEEKDNNPK